MDIRNNQQLKIALNDYFLEDFNNLPSESELAAQHTFSIRFEKKMQHLIHKVSKIKKHKRLISEIDQPSSIRPFSSRRKRLLLIAIVLALLLSLMSITAARELVFGFFVEIYEKFTTITFHSNPVTITSALLPSSADDIKDILPSNLPSGYSLNNLQITDEYVLVVYTNLSRDKLVLERQLSPFRQFKIDTENVQTEEIKLRQTQGLYYSNKGVQNLIWQEGSYAYAIFGIITKIDLINMAESINR